MKNKLLVSLAAVAIAIGGNALPSFANDASSFVGSMTSLVVDIPEGMLMDSLWWSPKKVWHSLADNFGDEKGFQQNVAGALLGIPVGMVWGIPHGAIMGGRHALSVGWEKPFSTESYIVSEEK
jgi:hypothetical protein